MNKLTKENIESLREADGILSDSDETLNNKTAYASFNLIEKCRKSKDYKNFLRGIYGGVYVYLGTHFKKLLKDETEAENWGLKKLHNFLATSKIPKNTIQEVTLDYLRNNEIQGAKDSLKTLRNFGKNKKFLIVTRNASLFAEPVREYFEADDYVANKTIFRGEFVDDVQISMKTPEERLKLTEEKTKKQGLDLKDCIFIGDSKPDLIFKPYVKIFMSSPKANNKVRICADVNIDNYRDFEKQLINSY